MVTATQTESDASLSHHGIKGMRWVYMEISMVMVL